MRLPNSLKSSMLRVGLLAASSVVGLVLIEVSLSILHGEPAYHVWPPNSVTVLHPEPGVMPGVSGASVF